MGKIGSFLLAFVGCYVLTSVLGAWLWPHVSTGVSLLIVLPVSLLAGTARVRRVSHGVGPGVGPSASD